MRRGKCTRCKKKNVWINTVIVNDTPIGEWCADCYDETGSHKGCRYSSMSLVRRGRVPGSGEGNDYFGNHT